jgi:site-specific recombinase XerD
MADDDPLLRSFELHLLALNRSPNTIKAYLSDARHFDTWRRARGARGLDTVAADEIKAYLAARISGDGAAAASPAYVARIFRSLQQLYRWLDEEGEIEASPMARMKPPQVPEDPVEVIPDADLRALLAVVERRPPAGALPRIGFELRRDRAMILLLLTTGIRSEGLMGLTVDDVDLRAGVFTVTEKGRRTRTVGLVIESPYGSAAEAVDRYMRARSKHKHAASPSLWLGRLGPLTPAALGQMLERRCVEAGLASINPHRFRHTWAHLAKAAGMTDENLKAIGGWRTQQMVERYARSASQERAIAAHREMFRVRR